MIRDFLLDSPLDLLFGLGPGTIREHYGLVSYEAHDPPWAKLVFEYGLVGATAFWAFFIVAVYADAPSRWVSVTLTIGFLAFGGMLLDARLQVLILVFCVLPKGSRTTPWPRSS
jgi:uncharacterized membrane protein YgdD (TMEM256/DUF423 family)